jgi:tetratricopeptide (TPR) repeat protein
VRTVLILAGVVGFFVFLGVNLSGATKPREEGMSATGLMPPGGGPMGAQGGGPMMDESKLQTLVQAARQSPNDADALGKLGIYLLRMQDFDNGKQVMLQANAVDPFNVKSRIGRAVLKALEGDMKGAGADLEHLAAYYPEAYDAHYFEGLIANENGDAAKALTELESYVSYAPEEEVPPMLTMAITELRQQVRPGK